MTQIILDKAILQEVWEDMRKPRIYEDQPNTLYYDSRYGWDCEIEVVPLPSGQYEILGLGSDLGEEQIRGLVAECAFDDRWFNYAGDYPIWFHSARESFKSLLRSHNLQPETTLVILKK